jgi:hypothetical protein
MRDPSWSALLGRPSCDNRIIIMRKRIVQGATGRATSGDSEKEWRDLQDIATVEVTSEDPRFPIESAFNSGGPGWRAAEPGEQRVRIIFDRPTSIRRIQLHFAEAAVERTQEFTLSWSNVNGGAAKETVRQQWNFSPTGSTREVEDYEVTLEDVSALELAIKPDLSNERAPAGLALWRVA